MKFQSKNVLAVTVLGCLLSLLAGCGGAGSTPTSNLPTPGANQSSSSITFGDAPADNILAFEVTVSSVTLTSSSGSVSVLSAPRRLELTHLSATVEPISLTNIPNGTYTSASVGWSSPEVTFLDDAGVLRHVESTQAGTTSAIPVNFTVNSGAVLNFDVNVAASVTVNTATGSATFSPAFTFSAGHLMNEVEREAETGELEHIVGSVVSSTANSVTISVGAAGTNMTFTTNASTQMEGVTSPSQLVAGQVIRVEGTEQSDGTMIAKEIEAESADGNGIEVEGLVTTLNGSSLTLIAHEACGKNAGKDDLGKSITVDVSSARFSIGDKKISGGGFSFSSLADLRPGQRIEVDNDVPKTAGAGTFSDDGAINGAKKIKLVQQALTGTISAASSNSFTLTLPVDSAFAKITTLNTVTVVVASNVQMKNGASITAGSTVRVRGLLFATGSSYTMVAGRITTP